VRLVRELERSFAAACERGQFRVAQYSIQGDHVHAIMEAASSADLASGMKSIAARLARAANRVFARRHAAKRGRSLRGPARIDPASSGRWFDGWSARSSAPGPDPPAVASPRSWLLRVGWRRHGLLRLEEVPG
jgi:hypothetical protein